MLLPWVLSVHARVLSPSIVLPIKIPNPTLCQDRFRSYRPPSFPLRAYLGEEIGFWYGTPEQVLLFEKHKSTKQRRIGTEKLFDNTRREGRPRLATPHKVVQIKFGARRSQRMEQGRLEGPVRVGGMVRMRFPEAPRGQCDRQHGWIEICL
jgi:hypothetical protein